MINAVPNSPLTIKRYNNQIHTFGTLGQISALVIFSDQNSYPLCPENFLS
jgi:hypothetical protein